MGEFRNLFSGQSKGKRNLLSLVAILLIAMVVVGVFSNMKRWRQPMKVIQWDIKNYYAYLPAVFIYGDHGLEFTREDPEFFGDKFWPIPTPSGGLVIVTSMGLAILYLPFFLMGHLAAWFTGAEMNGFSPPYAFFLVLSSLFYVIIGLFALRKVLLKYFSDGITAITLLAMFFATNLLFYTAHEGPMSHAYNFALFAIFMLLTIQWHEKPGVKNSLMLGLLAGLIVLVRPTNIVLLVFFVLYDVKSFNELKLRIVFLGRKYNLVLFMAVAAFLVWLPQMLYWKSVSGHWLYYSYKEEEGFFFGNPQIIRGLFSYRKGWLLYTPIMGFALLGIALLWKYRRAFFWPIFLFTVINIYVVLSWWSWWYGGGFGQRAFIESYALLAIPFATLLYAAGKWRKGVQRLLVTLTFLLMVHGIFQTAQYHYGAIHWDSMNKTTYWASFGRVKPLPGFYEAIDPPDYDLATKGIHGVIKREKPNYQVLESFVFDMETFDASGQFVLSENGKPQLNVGMALFDEKAYDGEHSLKLGRLTEQNISLSIPVQAGEQWVVSVKRNAPWFNGALVLTGDGGADFYKDIRIGLPAARLGWDSLSLQVEIPGEEVTKLKVILRSTGRLNTCFDDLRIEKVKKLSP
ncbi:MAG: hypothetical protein V2I46_09500 [Bacteroides sp.]|jgi:hypothetical protein|nr:hypothetical protein [Bacteroides sp.]